MTWSNDRLDADLRKLFASERDGSESALEPEMVEAMLRGEVTPEKREFVLDQLALDPELTKAVLDLEVFENLPQSPQQELPRWNEFISQELSQPTSRFSARAHPMYWLAASIFLFMCLALILGVSRITLSSQPGSVGVGGIQDINVFHWFLEPIYENTSEGSGGWRGSAPEVLLAEEEVALIILETVGRGDFEEYRIEMRTSEDRLLWRRTGLKPSSFGTFNFGIDLVSVPPGKYKVFLEGKNKGSYASVAQYSLAVKKREMATRP